MANRFYYPEPGTAFLFLNKHKLKTSDPDYLGSYTTHEGVIMMICAFTEKSQVEQKPYLKIIVEPRNPVKSLPSEKEIEEMPLLDQIFFFFTGMLASHHPNTVEAMEMYAAEKIRLFKIENKI